MEAQRPTCAILADRYTELSEGLRGLLETAFQTVYVVADPQSLQEGALRLLPDLIVLDLSLPDRDPPALLKKIRALSPKSRVIVLTVHDEPAVARRALASGAHSVVLKRSIGSDFLCAKSPQSCAARYTCRPIVACPPSHTDASLAPHGAMLAADKAQTRIALSRADAV